MEDLKQLRDLLKLLRAQGVLQYQSEKLNLVLSEAAPIVNRKPHSQSEDGLEEPDLTPEQEAERLLFYSAPDSPTD